MGACLSSPSTLSSSASSSSSSSDGDETESRLDERERLEREAGQRELRDMVARGLLTESRGEGKMDWNAVVNKAEELHRKEQALRRKRAKLQQRRRKREGVSTAKDGAEAGTKAATSPATADLAAGSGGGGGGRGGAWRRRLRERRLRRRRDALGSFSVNMATYRSNGEVVVLGDQRKREEFVEAERERAMSDRSEETTTTATAAASAATQAAVSETDMDAKAQDNDQAMIQGPKAPAANGHMTRWPSSSEKHMVPAPPPPSSDVCSPESSTISTSVGTDTTASSSNSNSNSGIINDKVVEARTIEEGVTEAETSPLESLCTCPTGSFEEAISGGSPAAATGKGGNSREPKGSTFCSSREGTMPTIME